MMVNTCWVIAFCVITDTCSVTHDHFCNTLHCKTINSTLTIADGRGSVKSNGNWTCVSPLKSSAFKLHILSTGCHARCHNCSSVLGDNYSHQIHTLMCAAFGSIAGFNVLQTRMLADWKKQWLNHRSTRSTSWATAAPRPMIWNIKDSLDNCLSKPRA